MQSGTLAVSFWNICLDNLPDGAFVRRSITPGDAKLLIEEARRENRLLCVSESDLIAPYRQDECNRHAELCTVLKEQFAISLELSDFTSRCGDGDDASYSINPLICVQINHHSRLLVVTCDYVLVDGCEKDLLSRFQIAPATVHFSMIEVMADVCS